MRLCILYGSCCAHLICVPFLQMCSTHVCVGRLLLVMIISFLSLEVKMEPIVS
uniref:Uncharacterized protein n=1 Tax=Arundo donax TaxID=35708 RepID=A0A0A9E056_ARUDO